MRASAGRGIGTIAMRGLTNDSTHISTTATSASFVHALKLAEPPSTPSASLSSCGHGDGSVEIAYIGLDARMMGRGLGRWLVSEATKTAWAWGASRVWLHTCTLDADAALPNYLARGFRPTRTERYVTEIAQH
jgi:GNAT superfamily N-acetyltransferase